MHFKIVNQKAVDCILRLKMSLGRRWYQFVRLLEFKAVDHSVKVEYFVEVLKQKFDLDISEKDLKKLRTALGTNL